MSRTEIIQALIDSGAIAVIRMSDTKKLLKVADAIVKGGITAIEITMTTPDALRVIETMSREAKHMLIGVGSVLDEETAVMAIRAGAQFVVSPVFKPGIINAAHRYDLPAMPGAFTPTEILTAHEQGADMVKIFPADVVGMAFFKAIKAPMPHLRLVPTGGVTLENGGDWIKAGACAVGVGGALLDKKAIEEEQYEVLTRNALKLREGILKARKQGS